MCALDASATPKQCSARIASISPSTDHQTTLVPALLPAKTGSDGCILFVCWSFHVSKHHRLQASPPPTITASQVDELP